MLPQHLIKSINQFPLLKAHLYNYGGTTHFRETARLLQGKNAKKVPKQRISDQIL